MRKVTLAIALVFMIGGVIESHAQGNSKGARDSRDSRSGGHSDVDVNVGVVFGSDQLRLIRQWFGNDSNLEGLPHGLAKRETLPPGLQRQLQKNGTLPPGLQSKLHPVPHDLERHLPVLSEGLRRVIIGGSIMLLNDASVIVDIAAIF